MNMKHTRKKGRRIKRNKALALGRHIFQIKQWHDNPYDWSDLNQKEKKLLHNYIDHLVRQRLKKRARTDKIT
jgi:hypothetical protein